MEDKNNIPAQAASPANADGVAAQKDTQKGTQKDAHGRGHAAVAINSRPQLIGAFLPRGMGAKFVQVLEKYGIFFVMTMLGQGTASSDILDILGLESAEKDAVIALAPYENAAALMNKLNDRLSGLTLGRGIAFRTPLSAASNLLVAAVHLRKHNAQEGKKMNTPATDKAAFSLIFLSVNQGYADEVMAVAKTAGARGGTMLRANQTATDGTVTLFGSAFSEAREVIAIIAPAEKRKAILEAVSSEHGVRSDAGVIALALAVEDVAKLS